MYVCIYDHGRSTHGVAITAQNTVPHAREDETVYNSSQDTPREEIPQVAETDQEANAPTDHVTDVRVPGEMTVEKHAKVFHSLALLDGLPTDPYADREYVSCVLPGTEEKDFSFGCVQL
ncbi:hypothetical protein FJT64_014673 [Amphibalanus amphitrite]|uniref:Uncharacterized protein n=1 Tax=Amphibalanus amphitrite TaxID=1232801 RepID=A0A6A4V5K8_AMPAM|nr:hypothetical protein FJT64_014673 [Amphibalanus amphitrite]